MQKLFTNYTGRLVLYSGLIWGWHFSKILPGPVKCDTSTLHVHVLDTWKLHMAMEAVILMSAEQLELASVFLWTW